MALGRGTVLVGALMEGQHHTVVWFGIWGVLYEPVSGGWVKLEDGDLGDDDKVLPECVAGILQTLGISFAGGPLECYRLLRPVDEPSEQPQDGRTASKRRKRGRRKGNAVPL